MSAFDIFKPKDKPAGVAPAAEPQVIAPISNTRSQIDDSGVFVVGLDDLAKPTFTPATLETKSTPPALKRIDDDFESDVKFAVVGAGQGGNRIADQFWRKGYRRVLLVNTTDLDMQNIIVPHERRVILKGNGAGKDPKVGLEAVNKGAHLVASGMQSAWGSEVDRVLVCVGGGGGTGTGSCLRLIDLSRNYMGRFGTKGKVGVIVTKPSHNESEQVHKNARELISKLNDMAAKGEITPLIVLDNEKALAKYHDQKSHQYWDGINQEFVTHLHLYSVFAGKQSPYTVFDPADLMVVLNSGKLVFGSAHLPGVSSSSELTNAALASLNASIMADDYDLASATQAACIVVASKEIYQNTDQRVFEDFYGNLKHVMGSNLTVHRGMLVTNQSGVWLYTVAGGLQKRA